MTDNLNRFIDAQKENYDIALNEIKNGYKRSHWIWYIFPQLKGLGTSATSEFYGIKDINEAQEYYNNEYLKSHLLEISKTLLLIPSSDIESIMGYPDNLKLHSSITLFNQVDPCEKVFLDILDKYYRGELDLNTISLLNLEK